MGDKVLVTGASGFVGSAIARALSRRGDEVRVLVRATSPRTNIEGEEFEIAEGDLLDRNSVLAAMDGVRFVFHVAADYRIWAPDPEQIVRNNLEGTRAVMDAARAACVERIVYTSSVAALKPVAGIAVDETSRHSEQTVIGAYKRSKLVAERLVERMAREGLPAVIVSPSTPIGPRDVKPTPTGRIIVQAASGGMPAYVDTGLNLVHVDDVAQGHLLALARGRIGENYILGGEDVRLKEMLAAICALVGRNPPRVRLPRGPLYPLAYCSEALARVSGKEPMLTVDALNMSKYHMFFSSKKARDELGFTTRPYGEAIADAVAWFRQSGYIK